MKLVWTRFTLERLRVVIPYMLLLCRFCIGRGALLSNRWRHRFTFHPAFSAHVQCVGFREEQLTLARAIPCTCESDGDDKGGIGIDCFPLAEPAILYGHKEAQTKESYQGESRETPLFELLQHSLIWLADVQNIKFKGGSPLLRASAVECRIVFRSVIEAPKNWPTNILMGMQIPSHMMRISLHGSIGEHTATQSLFRLM